MSEVPSLEELPNLSKEYWTGLTTICDSLVLALDRCEAGLRSDTPDLHYAELVDTVSSLDVRATAARSSQIYYSAQKLVGRKVFKQAKLFSKFFDQKIPSPTIDRNTWRTLLAEYCLYKDMGWYREFARECGGSDLGFPEGAVVEFEKMHARIASLREGDLAPALDWLRASIATMTWGEESRVLSKILKKLILASQPDLTVIRKFFHYLPNQPIGPLLLRPQPDLATAEKLLWHAFSVVVKFPTNRKKRRRSIAYHLEEPIERFQFQDPPDSSWCKKGSSTLGLEAAQSPSPLHPVNYPPPLFPESEDELLFQDAANFASNRTTLPDAGGGPTTSHPRLYPYSQSRDWLIGRILLRQSSVSVEGKVDVGSQTEEVCSKQWYRFPQKSRLETALAAGILAVPKFAMADRVANFWRTQNSPFFSIEIDHPNSSGHSIIVCPVLHQPCRAPLLLPCGHCISDTALARIVQASRGRSLKCPLCPAEVSSDSTRRISFP